MFFAYQHQLGQSSFHWEGRDESKGILGTFVPGESGPISQSESLEELETLAYARLGSDPDAFLYLTDECQRVCRILCNEKHHEVLAEWQSRASTRTSLLVLCCLCLMASADDLRGRLICGAYLICAAVYVVVYSRKSRFEGILACVILLVSLLAAIDFWKPSQ